MRTLSERSLLALVAFIGLVSATSAWRLLDRDDSRYDSSDDDSYENRPSYQPRPLPNYGRKSADRTNSYRGGKSSGSDESYSSETRSNEYSRPGERKRYPVTPNKEYNNQKNYPTQNRPKIVKGKQPKYPAIERKTYERQEYGQKNVGKNYRGKSYLKEAERKENYEENPKQYKSGNDKSIKYRPETYQPVKSKKFTPERPENYKLNTPEDYSPQKSRKITPERRENYKLNTPEDYPPQKSGNYQPEKLKKPDDYTPNVPKKFEPKQLETYSLKASENEAPKKTETDTYKPETPEKYAPDAVEKKVEENKKDEYTIQQIAGEKNVAIPNEKKDAKLSTLAETPVEPVKPFEKPNTLIDAAEKNKPSDSQRSRDSVANFPSPPKSVRGLRND